MMQHLIVITVLLLIFVHVECMTGKMLLGQFNNQYVVYADYILEDKSTLSVNLMNEDETVWFVHVNPRYQTLNGCSSSAMVLNNYFNDKWQAEIRPTGFPFLYNKMTTVVIIPRQEEYDIRFDVAGRLFAYTFPFRNGHVPEQVRELFVVTATVCSSIPSKITNFGTGFVVPSLFVGSAVRVEGTAPSDGVMIIDLSLGPPEMKNRVDVALRLRALFGNNRGITLHSVQQASGIELNKGSINNPIANGAEFSISIAIMRSVYSISVGGVAIGEVRRKRCRDDETTTIWATGMTTLNSISIS